MTDNSSQTTTGQALVWGAVLSVILTALYVIPASKLGFWQPWETSLATLGRDMAAEGINPFVPVIEDQLVHRPWLQLVSLKLGYSIAGGSELGFRLPLLAMNLFAALFGFGVLASLYGHKRAFLASLLFGISPVIFLSSLSLAGGAYYVAPVTIAMTAMGWLVARPGRLVAPVAALLGLGLALSLWGGGLIGLGIPLITMALFAVSEREPEQRSSMVGWGIAIGLGVVAAAPGLAWLNEGFETAKHGLALSALVFAPLAVLAAALPMSRVKALMAPQALAVWISVFVALTLWPWMTLQAGIPLPEALDGVEPTRMGEVLGFLLYNGFLNGGTLADHVTFDVALRYAGYAVYPMTFLVPLGYAYLYQTGQDDFTDTDDEDKGQRAFKGMMMIWAAIGFGLVTMAMTLSGQYIMPVAFPLVVPLALAATDRKFVGWLRENRAVYYAMGVTALMILAMTSKDVRGTLDEDAGRPGPQVVFEFLTVDGAVDFPEEYVFERIKYFFLLWAGIILLMFADVRRNLTGLANALVDTARDPSQIDGWQWAFPSDAVDAPKVGPIAGFLGKWVIRWVLIAGGGVGRAIHAVLRVRFAGSFGTLPGLTTGLLAFSVVALGWTADLAVSDVPALSHHFSQRGLLDTYEEIGEGAPFYTAGIAEDDSSYYLSDDLLDRLPRVSDIADLFCEAEGRVFVVIPANHLGEAYYHTRTHRECEDMQLHVVDGRSSRYVLTSNQLHTDAGETEQSFIAENTFTHDTIPETAHFLDEELTVDGKLRLVATEVSPSQIDSGEFTVIAYWEVLERISGNYEIFIHTDLGGSRINGDHDPVEGRYSMRYWVPGDIVRDQHTMEVGRAQRRGVYTVWYGFFRGDNRLEVSPPRGDNRINMGTLSVRVDEPAE